MDEGRILINIEKHASPTIGLTMFDSTGRHDIDHGPNDSSFAHSVWAGTDSVVFTSERNPPRHLYSLSTTDGSITQLTTTTGLGDDNPTVLPDTGVMAWEHYDDSNGRDLGMLIGPVGTADAKQLTPESTDPKVGALEPSLSPDGKWVAFVESTNIDTQAGGLFIVKTDGTGRRRLTDDAFHAYRPRWSPDSTTILVTKNYGAVPPEELWLVPVQGTPALVKGYPDGSFAFEADWSPSGKQIVFKYYSQGSDHNELRVMNADGTGEHTLWTGKSGYTAETPDWGM